MEFSVRFGFRKMISCASFREFDPKDMARFESKDKRFVLSVEFSLDLMNTGLRDASAHTIHRTVELRLLTLRAMERVRVARRVWRVPPVTGWGGGGGGGL